MPAYLNAVASAVPPVSYSQSEILEVMKEWHGGDRRTGRLLTGIYRASAISKRHSVVPDFLPGDSGGFFYDPAERRFLVPGTAQRNSLYASEAGELTGCAAGKALARAPGIGPTDVTHVITVSCTGFFAPGPDVELVDALGLKGSVERYHLGFMGCYGAFPALRLARALCLADPGAVVLVVSVELCTLHLQAAGDTDSLLAASVFADGCAAAIVSSEEPEGAGLRLDTFASALARDRAGEMAWTIGDTGFEMVLSSRLPQVVEEEVHGALAPLFESSGKGPKEIGSWAVHPGGRAILDRVEGALCLDPNALHASREVLAEYGNMSSATVLFVLERLLDEAFEGDPSLVSVAFGPGLSVESAMFTRTG
ncbi:MAG: type III polyketide synthase [Trueperaceae bacterium]